MVICITSYIHSITNNFLSCALDDGKKTKFRLFLSQMTAMFMKRIIYTTRNWFFLLVQLLYPVIWIILGLNTIGDVTTSLPQLNIDFKNYTDPIVFVNGSNIYKQAYIDYVQKHAEVRDIKDGDLMETLLNLVKLLGV